MSRPLILGVLNVTPDSFSDGGEHLDPETAVAHGLRLTADGADLVDVGGESTRPGAAPVSPMEEAARVLPVVAALVAEGVRVSIDTVHASTAEAAVAAGAVVVNDVSGGTADPAMLAAVAATGAEYVVMHSLGPAGASVTYGDVVREVADELERRVAAAVAAGIAEQRIVIDPGLGFAKGAADNWRLLAALPVFVATGRRVLVGASRKRFLGALLPEGAPMVARDLPTAVVSALAARDGVWAVRVHDVAATRLALEVAARTAGTA
jgi:dihydropteroate synthase